MKNRVWIRRLGAFALGLSVLMGGTPGYGDEAVDRSLDEVSVDPFESHPDPTSASIVQNSPQISDPIRKLNRKVYRLNDFVYFNVLKPTALGYKAVVPKVFRKSVRNFFTNLREPVYFVNSVFQGRLKDAQNSLCRFVVNSTIGIGGLRDPVMKSSDTEQRNFDQTLSKGHVRPGIFVMVPFVGPSSARGIFGMAGEEVLSPFFYGNLWFLIGSDVLETVNETSYEIGTYEDIKKYTVDTYSALKDIYEKMIYKKSQE